MRWKDSVYCTGLRNVLYVILHIDLELEGVHDLAWYGEERLKRGAKEEERGEERRGRG